MKDDKAKVYNLYEYNFAKKVVQDVPKIIVTLEEFQSKLYEHRQYRDVSDVLYSINEALSMLEIHYLVYKPVADKKGKLDE